MALLQFPFAPSPTFPEDVKRFTQLLKEKIAEKNDDPFWNQLFDDRKGKQLLAAIFGNSPYLSRLLLKNTDFFEVIIKQGYHAAFQIMLDSINPLPANIKKEQVASQLRIAKQRAALLIGMADITASWELEMVTSALSRFAETAVNQAVAYLLQEAVCNHDLKESSNSGLIVLAVGKLGADELNYSSDIDLILFFDPEKTNYTGRRTVQQFFIKLSSDLVSLLQDRTVDGYVFRTDLRLRPDPGSTPIAVSVQAAEQYYQTVGQNWERAALIKALPVAGDKKAAEEFLKKVIQPFIWRRSLDFAAQEDIRSIKRQIDSKQQTVPDNLAGYNIKIGHGGIREIEFYAQTQQLIWGGRYNYLRVPATCDALCALVKAKQVNEEVAEELIDIYRYYRMLEHRLQMVDDEQTHKLPLDEQGLRLIATFMGAPSLNDFIDDLRQKIATVKHHYADLFRSSTSLGMEGKSLIFTGTDNDPETLQTISGLGFSNATMVSERIRGWHHGRYIATQSKRARELLTELIPLILQAMSKTASPDSAFLKFDEFLSRVNDGSRLLSLLYAKPDILTLLAEIMGSYPYLAENLSRKPALLDYVLAADFMTVLPTTDALAEELRSWLEETSDFDEIIDIAKRWTHERQFQVGIQLIRHLITPAASRKSLSDIAEAVLDVLLDQTERDFAVRHGTIIGGQFAVVAMGKLGARNLTFRSDIDMILIYNTPYENDVSNGSEPLDNRQYYSRLSRKYINAITNLTTEGVLYSVDMRLRPSGKDGPVCSRLTSIDHYFGTSAQIWEYMALTKARVISGDSHLAEEITTLLHHKLQHQWDKQLLASEIRETRQKIDRQYHTDDAWRIKHIRGGLFDIEFIAQFLQLSYGYLYPQLIDYNIMNVFRKCAELQLLDAKTAQELIDAASFLFDIQSFLRLAYQGKLTPGVMGVLASGLDKPAFKQVKDKLLTTQHYVLKSFDAIIACN